MTRENFPETFQFLAGYFHEDWSCDNENEDDVIRHFIADSSIETLSQVKSELRVILNTLQNEEEMEVFLLEEINCSYYYPYAWPSGRAWIKHVLFVLSENSEEDQNTG